MADGERPIFEELLDVFVYAPLGALLEIVEDFPRHAATGRERLEQRLNAARLTGRLTVATIRRGVETRLGANPGESMDAPAPSPMHTEPPADAPFERVPDPSELAIPGYDALAASQVVARLAALTQSERELVRIYERATRGRRTILGKIAQLDGG